jgi:5'-3' exonuclease
MNKFKNMYKTLIVDADSIAFAAALQEDLEAKEKVKYAEVFVEKLLAHTGCNRVELYFTVGRDSFRYKVDPTYKANRKGQVSPHDLHYIKEELNKIYLGELCTEYEADDIVVLRGKQKLTLVAAMDKDVLGQLVGTHFNYHFKHWCYEKTTRKEAKVFLWQQMIQGDSIDGVYGIEGMGKIKAQKYLADKVDYKKAVWDLYKKFGKTKKEFLNNLNLLDMHMLNKKREITLNEGL